jgi:hypothetical protein
MGGTAGLGGKQPTDPATHLPVSGVAQLAFSRIRGADYRVEMADPVTTGTPTWQAVVVATNPILDETANPPAALANPIPASFSAVNVIWVENLSVAKHLFRIVPVFAGGPGSPTKTATVTIAN